MFILAERKDPSNQFFSFKKIKESSRRRKIINKKGEITFCYFRGFEG
jgi:hypothetical protein